jgi:WD40 repeat protein
MLLRFHARSIMRFRFMAVLLSGLWPAVVAGQEPVTIKDLGGWVGAVAFSPEGRHLAIGTSDGKVGIWHAAQKERVLELTGQTDAVAALVWSADCKTLVSGGHDHLVILHDVDLEQKKPGETRILRGHIGAVMAVALSGDGSRVYSGSIDGSIRVWDMKSGARANVVSAHTSWVNSLALSGNSAASAGSDRSLRLWRLPDWEPVDCFRVKEGELRSVAWSPDRKLVAAGIRYGKLRVWDMEMKKEVASLSAHKGETWAVAFTPDGKFLASGGGDWNQPGEVRLWDSSTWQERAVLKHSGEVVCLAISADGRALAAGSWDRTVRIWDLTSLAIEPRKPRAPH